MTLVRFAVTCDVCQTRGEEYAGANSCKGCDRDLCRACEEPGTADDEHGRAMCRDCAGYALEGMR